MCPPSNLNDYQSRYWCRIGAPLGAPTSSDGPQAIFCWTLEAEGAARAGQLSLELALDREAQCRTRTRQERLNAEGALRQR